MVKRKDDWPKLLSEYLAERKKMPFEWGVNDCMAFVSKGVERLTGEPYFESYSDYHDEETATNLLEKHGGIVQIINNCLGQGTRNLLKAKRGDVAIVKLPAITGALVDDSGQHIVMVTEKDGLTRLPLSKAWRIWNY